MIKSSGCATTDCQGGRTLTAKIKTYLTLLVAVVMLFSATPVQAAPTVSDKRDEARRIKAQVDELDQQVEVASEAYNEANAKHQAIVTKIKRTQADLDKTNAEINRLQTHLQVRANSMYRSGPTGLFEVLLGAKSFEELATTWDLLKDMNRQEAVDVASLKDAKTKAEVFKTTLASQEADAKKTLDTMAARKRSIEAKLASRKSMLSGVEGEVAAMEAAAEARAAAAARASVSRSSGTSRKFPPPTRAPRTAVVSIAKKYLGAPYHWGASGPNSFDCSGFTMFVYSQVGVSLPHSSRAQYGCGQKVSRADLKPGDLVFFGSPIHHVGIYVGGGMYIHAPHTGDVVRISALDRGDFVGGCRP